MTMSIDDLADAEVADALQRVAEKLHGKSHADPPKASQSLDKANEKAPSTQAS